MTDGGLTWRETVCNGATFATRVWAHVRAPHEIAYNKALYMFFSKADCQVANKAVRLVVARLLRMMLL